MPSGAVPGELKADPRVQSSAFRVAEATRPSTDRHVSAAWPIHARCTVSLQEGGPVICHHTGEPCGPYAEWICPPQNTDMVWAPPRWLRTGGVLRGTGGHGDHSGQDKASAGGWWTGLWLWV